MVFKDHSFLIGCILAVTIVAVSSYGRKMLGPGRWYVIKTDICKNSDQLRYKLNITRWKENRTHDSFSGFLELLDEIDNSYGMRMTACKFMDGGCKPFQEISTDCFCCFMKEHTERNFVNALGLMGVSPADCPIPPGKYAVEKFMCDYEALPTDGLYGMYLGEAYILKDGVDLGCLAVTAEYKEE